MLKSSPRSGPASQSGQPPLRAGTSEPGFAAVHGIRVHPDGLDGGADPGHDGIVLAV